MEAVVISIVTSLLGRVFGREAENWADRSAEGLVGFAAQWIVSEERDRYLQEWMAELDELDEKHHQFVKLAYALSLALSIPSINLELAAGDKTITGWARRVLITRLAILEVKLMRRGQDKCDIDYRRELDRLVAEHFAAQKSE